MRRLTIDCSEKAQKLVEEMLACGEMLAAMTEEMFTDNPRMLLSSIFRKMMAEKGTEFLTKYRALTCKGQIYIDAPRIKDDEVE